jgi:hypothetical protein
MEVELTNIVAEELYWRAENLPERKKKYTFADFDDSSWSDLEEMCVKETGKEDN